MREVVSFLFFSFLFFNGYISSYGRTGECEDFAILENGKAKVRERNEA